MEPKQEKIKTFQNPRTGKSVRCITHRSGMVEWQRKETRSFDATGIYGSLDNVLDAFNKASRDMIDPIFGTSYGYDTYSQERDLSVDVTGWIVITIDEAEKFLSDRDRTVSEQEVADREAARQQIERLRAQYPGL